MVDVATLGLAVNSRDVVSASADLDRLTAASKKAEAAAGGFGTKAEQAARKAAAANDNAARSADRLTRSVTANSRAFRALRTVVAPLLALFSLGAMARYGDEWSTLEWRVQNATGSLANARATLNDLGRVARASWSPIEQVAEGFLRQEASLSALGYTTKQQIDLLEALNSAILISGLRGQRAQMVADAWAKATARGSLRGEELNTVLLNSSRLSELLADTMGVSVNELRKLGEEGKITTGVMFGITDQLAQLRKEMEGDATLAGGFTLLRNEMLMFFGMLDKATGFTSSLGAALVIVADGFAALRRALIYVTSNLDQVAEAAGVVGVALSLAFGRAALTVLATSFGWFVGGVLSGLTAIKVAVMANPLGAIATGLMIAVAGAYYFRDEIQKAIGVDVVGIAKTAANLVIGSFVAAYEDIKFVWNNFPTIMSAAITGAVNFVIRGVNKMVNSAIDGINKLINGLNSLASFFGADKAAQFFGFSGKIGEIDPWGGIAEMDNPAAADLSAAAGARNAAVEAALARDYIGELGAAFKTSEQAAADFGSAVAGANQNLENTGGGGGAADKAAKAIKGVADEAAKAAQAALDFGKDLVKGFVSDLRSGLEQGKGFWKSFGDAAMNALDKIVDKLLNNVLDALFQVSGFGGGGLLGGIGALFGLPFAKGGVFDQTGVTAFAKGGIVEKATVFPFAKGIGLMGEAGPEAIMPLHRGPDGSLGVRAANQNHTNNNQPIRIEVVSRFDADGGFESAVERSSRPIAMQESAKAAGQVAKSVPGMVDQRVNTRQTRGVRP